MAMACLHPRRGSRNVLEKPLAVREGDHEVQISLPYCDRGGDFRHAEAPVVAEGQVIVNPSVPPVCEAPAHATCPCGCEALLIEGEDVDVGDQAPQCLCQFLVGDSPVQAGVLVHPNSYGLLALESYSELLDVLGTHPLEEIEVRLSEGADASEGRGGLTAIR